MPRTDVELLERGSLPYYNRNMLSGIEFLIDQESKNRGMKALLGATRWNQYFYHWPVALAALRQLWEMGRVSELKSPFYEPFEKPINRV
jgi:hypothetical protein